MFDSASSDNLQDFRRRYMGSYGLLGEEVVKIVDVTSTSVHFIKQGGWSYQATVDAPSPVVFTFTQVPTTWFLCNGSLVFSCRVPRRQWCRGITDANTSFSFPSAGRLVPLEASFDLVRDCLKTPVAQEVADGFLLSRNFAIHAGTVFARGSKIGKCSNNKIKLDSSLFVQEVQDAIRRSKLNLEIVE